MPSPAVTLRIQTGTVESPLRAFLEASPSRLMPCFEERHRRQGFLLGRFAITVDGEGRFADSVNRLGRSYLRLELSRAEKRCVADGLAELSLPPEGESWSAMVEFDDPAVRRGDGDREWLRAEQAQRCELPPLDDVECAARYVVYEPMVSVRVAECSGDACEPVARALEARLPMLSHCIWFTEASGWVDATVGVDLAFDATGALALASYRPAGLAPLSAGEDAADVRRCLSAAVRGLRSPEPLEASLVVTIGRVGDAGSVGAGGL